MRPSTARIPSKSKFERVQQNRRLQDSTQHLRDLFSNGNSDGSAESLTEQDTGRGNDRTSDLEDTERTLIEISSEKSHGTKAATRIDNITNREEGESQQDNEVSPIERLRSAYHPSARPSSMTDVSGIEYAKVIQQNQKLQDEIKFADEETISLSKETEELKGSLKLTKKEKAETLSALQKANAQIDHHAIAYDDLLQDNGKLKARNEYLNREITELKIRENDLIQYNLELEKNEVVLKDDRNHMAESLAEHQRKSNSDLEYKQEQIQQLQIEVQELKDLLSTVEVHVERAREQQLAIRADLNEVDRRMVLKRPLSGIPQDVGNLAYELGDEDFNHSALTPTTVGLNSNGHKSPITQPLRSAEYRDQYATWQSQFDPIEKASTLPKELGLNSRSEMIQRSTVKHKPPPLTLGRINMQESSNGSENIRSGQSIAAPSPLHLHRNETSGKKFDQHDRPSWETKRKDLRNLYSPRAQELARKSLHGILDLLSSRIRTNLLGGRSNKQTNTPEARILMSPEGSEDNSLLYRKEQLQSGSQPSNQSLDDPLLMLSQSPPAQKRNHSIYSNHTRSMSTDWPWNNTNSSLFNRTRRVTFSEGSADSYTASISTSLVSPNTAWFKTRLQNNVRVRDEASQTDEKVGLWLNYTMTIPIYEQPLWPPRPGFFSFTWYLLWAGLKNFSKKIIVQWAWLITCMFLVMLRLHCFSLDDCQTWYTANERLYTDVRSWGDDIWALPWLSQVRYDVARKWDLADNLLL